MGTGDGKQIYRQRADQHADYQSRVNQAGWNIELQKAGETDRKGRDDQEYSNRC